MTLVSRRVASVPVRTSVETWNVVVALLSRPDHAARTTLQAITSIAAMLIAEEYTRDAPVVIVPASGPRVRVYTVHGSAAAADSDESPLATWPLAEPGWHLSLPCATQDLDDVRAALRPYSCIDVRDSVEGTSVDTPAPASRGAGSMSIDYAEMERP